MGPSVAVVRRTVSRLELTRGVEGIPMTLRREALEAKCVNGFSVNTGELIDDMEYIINPRSSYFELAGVCSPDNASYRFRYYGALVYLLRASCHIIAHGVAGG